MSHLVDVLVEVLLATLVKAPGYGIVRLVKSSRGETDEPGDVAAWGVGILLWAVLIGLGWLLVRLAG